MHVVLRRRERVTVDEDCADDASILERHGMHRIDAGTETEDDEALSSVVVLDERHRALHVVRPTDVLVARAALGTGAVAETREVEAQRHEAELGEAAREIDEQPIRTDAVMHADVCEEKHRSASAAHLRSWLRHDADEPPIGAERMSVLSHPTSLSTTASIIVRDRSDSPRFARFSSASGSGTTRIDVSFPPAESF